MSSLDCPDAPAIAGLVHHTGKKGDAVVAGGLQHGVVHHVNLCHAGDGIGAGAQGRGEGDGVARVKRMDFAKMIVYPPVVPSQRHVAVPDAGAGEMSRALGQRRIVRPLHDLHFQTDGRDFQRPQTAVAVIEIGGHIGKGGDGAAGGGIGRHSTW